MKSRLLLLYSIALSIPILLGIAVWQSSRYASLEREITRLEASQQVLIESNKELITAITTLSGPERIEHYATSILGLIKIRPEQVMQIRIEGSKHTDG
ncbi:MAG: septum formation initiator family protein [Treponema sp.]|nr:septum formation initiator family protein [Treponema sp.]